MKRIHNSILMQQKLLVDAVANHVYASGNLNGIPQWRDRHRLYKLRKQLLTREYLLSMNDFQFLESLFYKYKT
jgi:hypothetical protein